MLKYIFNNIFQSFSFIFSVYHTGYAYFAAKGYRGFDMNKLSIFTTIRWNKTTLKLVHDQTCIDGCHQTHCLYVESGLYQACVE